MNLTQQQLSSIEEMAYRLVPPQLVALNIEVDELDFLHHVRIPGTMSHKAYYQGYLRQIVETRESIIKAAKNGSNPAQAELLKFMNEVNLHLKYE